MHDLLFERYSEWSELPVEQMPEILAGYAEELGLDADQLGADLENRVYEEKVAGYYEDAAAMLGATPSFIVNGRLVSFQYLDLFIRLALLEPDLYDTPPPDVIDPGKQYVATISTAKGDIVVELYADKAPANVNSFVFLAHEGWYDGVTFHRVIPGFVVQAGDPTGIGVGGPGYQCDDEITDLGFDEAGVVGIASAGPNTGSSQFFIVLAPQPDLNSRYTVIGKVVEGLDVVEALTPRDPQTDPGAPPGDVIETIVVEER